MERDKSGNGGVRKRLTSAPFRQHAGEREGVLKVELAQLRKWVKSRNPLGQQKRKGARSDRWVGIGLIRVFRPKEGKEDDLNTGEY